MALKGIDIEVRRNHLHCRHRHRGAASRCRLALDTTETITPNTVAIAGVDETTSSYHCVESLKATSYIGILSPSRNRSWVVGSKTSTPTAPVQSAVGKHPVGSLPRLGFPPLGGFPGIPGIRTGDVYRPVRAKAGAGIPQVNLDHSSPPLAA